MADRTDLGYAYRMLRVREAAGLERGEMARVYGVTYQTYGNWEAGRCAPGASARVLLHEMEAGRAPQYLRRALLAREIKLTDRLLDVAKKYGRRM